MARIILETILGRPLKDISVQGQRVFFGSSPQKHGIRLDALITEATSDVSGNVIYDLEPDKKESDKKDFPRRGRYYHVLRDSKLLPSGVEYVRLPDSYVIFITPYDPFGSGRMLYSMQTMCAEDNGLPYDDGAYTLYLYTKGDPSTATPAISALLATPNYMISPLRTASCFALPLCYKNSQLAPLNKVSCGFIARFC